MVKVTCGKCNFHFERFAVPKLCPYCGSDSTVYEDEDATDILKDVDSMIG